jgi:hypothetical protein
VTALDSEALQGSWVHSYEEDRGDEMVLRPAGHELPPSRGRMSLELRGDGTYVESRPGPVDKPVEESGRWSLAGERLVLEGPGERRSQSWRVAAAEGDRLRLAPPDG